MTTHTLNMPSGKPKFLLIGLYVLIILKQSFFSSDSDKITSLPHEIFSLCVVITLISLGYAVLQIVYSFCLSNLAHVLV